MSIIAGTVFDLAVLQVESMILSLIIDKSGQKRMWHCIRLILTLPIFALPEIWNIVCSTWIPVTAVCVILDALFVFLVRLGKQIND